jgi:hypothetical protein
MPDWVSIYALINLILCSMTIEAAWLIWRHQNSTSTGAPAMLLHLMSGALLLLAMQLALAGVSELVVAGTLGMAGITHLADLRVNLSRN